MKVDFPLAVPRAEGCEFTRLLGIGATAQVWLGSRCGREVAIKCFSPGLLKAEEQLDSQLALESMLMIDVKHPHLLALYDLVSLSGSWEPSPALILQYAAGGALAHVLQHRKTLAVGEVVTFSGPILQALEYLHLRSLSHGDVSAGNVLFTAEGKPLLADFGQARMRAQNPSSRVGGTPHTLDPLLFQHSEESELHRYQGADVYAVAALIQRSLLGHYPTEPTDPRRTLRQLKSSVPTSMATAIADALAPQLSARPTAGEFAREVFSSAESVPLDLMASVHPSVRQDLPTRLRIDSAGQLSKLRVHDDATIEMEDTIPSASTRAREEGPPSPRKGRRGDYVPTKDRDRLIPEPSAEHNLASTRRTRSRKAAAHRLASGRRRAIRSSRRSNWRPQVGLKVAWSSRALGVGLVAASLLLGMTAAVTWLSNPRVEPSSVAAAPPNISASTQASSPRPGQSRAASDAEVSSARANASDSDPVIALKGIVALRAVALRTADAELLDEILLSGSPASIADRKVVQDLAVRKHKLTGLRGTLLEGRTSTRDGELTLLTARTELSPYSEIDVDGREVNRVANPVQQTLTFGLIRIGGQWKLSEVRQG